MYTRCAAEVLWLLSQDAYAMCSKILTVRNLFRLFLSYETMNGAGKNKGNSTLGNVSARILARKGTSQLPGQSPQSNMKQGIISARRLYMAICQPERGICQPAIMQTQGHLPTRNVANPWAFPALFHVRIMHLQWHEPEIIQIQGHYCRPELCKGRGIFQPATMQMQGLNFSPKLG